MNSKLPRVVVLISGQGRNLQAILEAVQAGKIPAQISAVISNKANAAGLVRARAADIPAFVLEHTGYASRSNFDEALAAAIDQHGADIVVLAGFMRILGDAFIQRYQGRLLNIHPSLLPKYPGLDTHQKALDAGDVEHGASVHFVTEQLDGGPCIIQGRLSVGEHDGVQILAERVMNEIELKIYSQALAWMARGDLLMQNGQIHFRGQRLSAPLGLNDLEPEFR